MSNVSLRAIPWSHESNEMGAVWKWETDHFQIIVNGNVRSCYYRIEDKSTGRLRPFADGQAGTFDDAELLIRETIGKAYPKELGYGPYAGYLATTFITASGRKMDFSQFLDQRVTVTVLQPDGSEHEYEGILSIHHYHVELRTDKVHLQVYPSYIKSVAPVVQRETRKTGGRVFGRTYKGSVEPGCTGRPGMDLSLVDHDGLACPIHEE